MTIRPTILAFDTSGPWCAAALKMEGRVLQSRQEEMPRGQAERLMPMIEDIVRAEDASLEKIDAIGVGIGPGNFTGIRIAVSAARGLALALGIPAIGVSTFEIAARGAEKECVLLEGPRGTAYVSQFVDGRWSAPLNIDLNDAGTELNVPSGALITGYMSELVAERCQSRESGSVYRLGRSRAGNPAVQIANIVSLRPAPTSPPAPLYIRPADAAPASDPPPVILS